MTMKNYLLFACMLLLSGCGFHTRSEADIPTQLKTLYISNTNGRSNLTAQLGASLQQLGVTTVKEPDQAPVTLAITSDNFSQVSSTLGTAQTLNTITLNYNVTYELRSSTGKIITPATTINTNTTYLQNASEVLGASSALPALEESLTRDMVELIQAHLGATQTRQDLIKTQP